MHFQLFVSSFLPLTAILNKYSAVCCLTVWSSSSRFLYRWHRSCWHSGVKEVSQYTLLWLRCSILQKTLSKHQFIVRRQVVNSPLFYNYFLWFLWSRNASCRCIGNSDLQLFTLYSSAVTVCNTRFNIQKFSFLPTQGICVFSIDLRKNGDYSSVHQQLYGFYNRDGVFTARYDLCFGTVTIEYTWSCATWNDVRCNRCDWEGSGNSLVQETVPEFDLTHVPSVMILDYTLELRTGFRQVQVTAFLLSEQQKSYSSTK